MSDQNPAGGWTNQTGSSYNGQENSDECAWLNPGTAGGAANVKMGNGTYAEQASWSNDTNACAISHPIVVGGGSGVSVANPGSQTGTVGTAVSLQLSASGGTAPYTWTATGLPAGLSISSGGLISGTPSTAGTSSVTATAKDSTGATGSASFSWTLGTGGGCTSPGQKLGNPGFESGGTVWSATSGVIGQYGSQGEPTHSGSWDAWLDGYGSTHTDTLSQSVTIPAGCKASLSVYLHIDTADTSSTAHDKQVGQVVADGTVEQDRGDHADRAEHADGCVRPQRDEGAGADRAAVDRWRDQGGFGDRAVGDVAEAHQLAGLPAQ